MKPINLTQKEIQRACDGLTVVVRLQASTNLYMVAAVNVQTGLPVFKPSMVSKSEIHKAVRTELRMASKCGMGGSMADASRFREVS